MFFKLGVLKSYAIFTARSLFSKVPELFQSWNLFEASLPLTFEIITDYLLLFTIPSNFVYFNPPKQAT